MKLLVSNFLKFLSLEIRGHKNNVKFYNHKTATKIPSQSESNRSKTESDATTSNTTQNKYEENMELDLRSLNKREGSLMSTNESSVRSDYNNYSYVLNLIPQNLLVHMARLPYFFERLIYHSVGICFDSLLFELTFMPIQAITTISHFIIKIGLYIRNEVANLIKNELIKPLMNIIKSKGKDCNAKKGNLSKEDKSFETVRSYGSFEGYTNEENEWKKINSAQSTVTLTEICGCVRFLVLVVTIYIFSFIDTSKVYHNIKGQPLMKLYVIFNMLEICERLCRSFSRDIMDSLIRTTIKIFINHLKEENDDVNGSSDRFNSSDDYKCRSSQTNGSVSTSKSKGKSPQNKHSHTQDSSQKLSSADDYEKRGDSIDFSGLEDEIGTSMDVNDAMSQDGSSRGTIDKNISNNGKNALNNVDYSKENMRDSRKSSGSNTRGTKESRVMKYIRHNGRGFLTAKSGNFIPLETFFGNQHADSILYSCRKYSDSFNIYYKFVFLYVFVVATISFHSFLHLVRVLSLNIAINSPESTMFLLLITNNFSEIKSTVFKKYDILSLFVVFASDAVERCYLFCDGLLVILKMSTSKRHLRSYITVLSWLVVIYGLEMLIDLFKHGYLIKFNRIRSETFEKYNSTLVIDTLLSRSVFGMDKLTYSRFEVPCKGSFSFSHISSRRLGFMSSPIVTLIVCSLPKLGVYLSIKTFAISVLVWLSLLFMKISISILLTAYGIEKREDIYILDPSYYKIGSL